MNGFKIKKIGRLLALLMIVQAIFMAPIAKAEEIVQERVDEIGINAYSAMAIDVETGEVIYHKNETEKVQIASLTKVMTALVISERFNLDKKITSKKNYREVLKVYSGPQMLKGGIKKNETFKSRELFNVMLSYSANDATLLFADTISGSDAKFVQLMNSKAKKLGMSKTHFVNSNGLSSKKLGNGQYSTAKDYSKLIRAAVKSKAIMTAAKNKQVKVVTNFRSETYKSTNTLLSKYEGVFGLKTGTTNKAGSCLASLCQIGSKTYAIVTLGGTGHSKADRDHMLIYDAIKGEDLSQYVSSSLTGLEDFADHYYGDQENYALHVMDQKTLILQYPQGDRVEALILEGVSTSKVKATDYTEWTLTGKGKLESGMELGTVSLCIRTDAEGTLKVIYGTGNAGDLFLPTQDVIFSPVNE